MSRLQDYYRETVTKQLTEEFKYKSKKTKFKLQLGIIDYIYISSGATAVATVINGLLQKTDELGHQ